MADPHRGIRIPWPAGPVTGYETVMSYSCPSVRREYVHHAYFRHASRRQPGVLTASSWVNAMRVRVYLNGIEQWRNNMPSVSSNT